MGAIRTSEELLRSLVKRVRLLERRLAVRGSSTPGNLLAMTGEAKLWFGRTAPDGWILAQGQALSRVDYADLFALLNPVIGTFTVTIANPAVVTRAAHGLYTGAMVYLTTTGALPTGLAQNTAYYVIRVDANTFRLATSLANAGAGTAIATSGAQNGVHTVRATSGVGDGVTTFNAPDMRGVVPTGLDTAQAEFDALGESGGAKTHTLTVPQMPAHQHNHNQSDGGNLSYSEGGGVTSYTTGFGSGRNNTGIVTGQTGGGQAHPILSPYRVVNFIVKT